MLAKTLYADDEQPFNSMFNTLLVDQTKAHDGSLVGGRRPKMSEETSEILSEGAIRIYLTYYDQLKKLFTKYIDVNFNNQNKDEPAMTWQ